jgi:hypothetical protein
MVPSKIPPLYRIHSIKMDGTFPKLLLQHRDISQYRLLFGLSLLYTDRVPFELLDSAALQRRESCGGGDQIVFLNLITII